MTMKFKTKIWDKVVGKKQTLRLNLAGFSKIDFIIEFM